MLKTVKQTLPNSSPEQQGLRGRDHAATHSQAARSLNCNQHRWENPVQAKESVDNNLLYI